MKILFIAEPYSNLHQPIIDEMRTQGHEVVYFEDRLFEFDWRQGWRGKYDKIVTRCKCAIYRNFQNYWKKCFREFPQLNQHFDVLFIVNGYSYHPYLLHRLKAISPGIKSVLYLWDNSSFYDFYHYMEYFDKIATYDLSDSHTYNALLLPFYYTKDMNPSTENKYLISTIGSNHSGRLEICRKVHSIIEEKINYGLCDSIIDNNDRNKWIYLKVVDKGLPEDNIVVHHNYDLKDVIEIVQRSLIVLDTDRESQTGTTPRLIWALAMGKKIITTNNSISKFPFYNPKQILIIDRDGIVIPDTFITDNGPIESQYDISYLRIDNWVKNLLRL